MGKAARQRRKQKKQAEKRAQRATNQAKYAEWRRQGVNKKSKRATVNSRKKKGVGQDHPNGPCGNTGCKKCFPKLNRRVKPGPQPTRLQKKVARLKARKQTMAK